MREDFDLEAAVAAGIVGEDQALAIRNLDAARSGITAASAERVEIASGFADIMAALGLAAFFFAAFFLQTYLPWSPLLVIPALLWAGTRFTVERRMSASAFILFFYFAVLLAGNAVVISVYVARGADAGLSRQALEWPGALTLVAGLVTAGCYLWWRITKLPVAVAAGYVSLLNGLTQLVRLLFPDVPTELVSWIHLGWGLLLLIAALWWDMTDIRRETIRSRVAFWCHGAAGFFLARAVMIIVAGRNDTLQGWHALYVARPAGLEPAGAAAFLFFFLLCGVLALLMDRRSLIFATLYHATLAAVLLVQLVVPGPAGLAIAMAMLGAMLFGLALSWRRARAGLLRLIPVALAAQLPRTELIAQGRRPTRRHQEMQQRRRATFGRAVAIER